MQQRHLNISIKNMLRLKVDKYNQETDIKKHGFFRHHWYQLKFISVIQLAKLFSSSKNEKRSFNKLCSTLEGPHYGLDFQKLLKDNASKPTDVAKSRDDILKITSDTMKILEANKALINKVVDSRNQIHAHKDPDPKAGYVNSKEIEQLVKIASELHNNFEFKIFFRTTMFSESRDWDVDYVLWYMSELRKRNLDELERKKNPSHNKS